ncbi:MAG: AAA family ATPase [Desulfobacterales bacterium]
MSCIYPIGGGKGGIGKSFIAANLGVLLAKQENRVVLVDLDLGASNLHTFTGMSSVKTGIEKFLNKTVIDLTQVAVPTEIENLSIISSVNCSMEIANLFAAQKIKIIKAIQNLPFDYVLLDLGAGTNFNTLDFFLSSNEGILLLTPEPTSIENAFKFIKAVYLRKVRQILNQREFRSVTDCINSNDNSIERTSRIIDAVAASDPEKGELLRKELTDYRFNFIINQFRKTVDPKLGEKIEKVCNRYFYSTFHFLGNVCFDERVHESIYSKKIFINKYSYTVSAIDLSHIVKKLEKNKVAGRLESIGSYG